MRLEGTRTAERVIEPRAPEISLLALIESRGATTRSLGETFGFSSEAQFRYVDDAVRQSRLRREQP